MINLYRFKTIACCLTLGFNKVATLPGGVIYQATKDFAPLDRQVQRSASRWPVRAETSSTSCDQAVFVDQAPDASLSCYAVLLKVNRFG